MPSYLIGQITVKDEILWQEYVDGVSESLAPFDASILFRGKKSGVLAGENSHQLVVVIEFSGQETLTRWFQSDLYQSLIPLRDRAADVTITTYTT
jgi:uncharacterized protein (DUF1330 family)